MPFYLNPLLRLKSLARLPFIDTPQMRALGFSSWGNPQSLQIIDVPKPEIKTPDDILIKVAAISLNGFDAVRLAGYSRLFETISLPFIPAIDFSGTVSAVGTAQTKFAPGSPVYGTTLPGRACTEYLLLSPTHAYSISHIPRDISFTDSASLPAVARTVLTCLFQAEKELEGGLKGKTVLVPAGLGGTGSLLLQLLKPVFGAEKVITTVSSKKVVLVEKLLGEGLVDRVIDYTKQDVVNEIGKGTVDVLFEMQSVALSYLPVMKNGGVIYTITGKSGTTMKRDWPGIIGLVAWLMDVVVWYTSWRASRWGIRYEEVYVGFNEDVDEKISRLVEEGKLKAVVGRKAKMGDLEAVKEMFETIVKGKGGVGKYVISID